MHDRQTICSWFVFYTITSN